MTLKFYNTLTSQVDEFVSIIPNKVTLYTCGPTVYSYPHIGNWAAYIYWDTLVRILMVNKYDVTRVMNITDVGHLTSDADDGEDKLEVGARREGKTAWEIAKFYTDDFINGMTKLGLIIPQHIAKATDYIPQQLDLVKTLKEKGYTYQISDGIYFDTSKFPTYADFAHLNLEDQKAGARVEFNPEKHNSSDFALWKFTPTGGKRDMQWETPSDLLELTSNNETIIMGFPGWHLECSAMALNILGNTIDIHTGGIDHLPVHHTNEIAQSEAATGVRFSNYWLHNNFLMVNGAKISKSIGNVYTLYDIEAKGFSLLDFRMLILQGSYRNEGNFTFKSLEAAKNRLRNWRNVVALRHQIHDTIQSNNEKNISLYATSGAIIEAIDDDLGTPSALTIIDDTFNKIAKAKLTDIDRQSFIQLIETIDLTLGLQLMQTTPDISDDSKAVILERKNARIQKDWNKSDKLRNVLLSDGIVVRDSEQDSIWEYRA